MLSTFTTFYNVTIPEPVINSGIEQLAQFRTPYGAFEVCWLSKSKQVVIHNGKDWWIQPNGLISKSLASILDCNELNLQLTDLILFDRDYKSGDRAPEELENKFFDCEWSDYACDKMVFQAVIDIAGSD